MLQIRPPQSTTGRVSRTKLRLPGKPSETSTKPLNVFAKELSASVLSAAMMSNRSDWRRFPGRGTASNVRRQGSDVDFSLARIAFLGSKAPRSWLPKLYRCDFKQFLYKLAERLPAAVSRLDQYDPIGIANRNQEQVTAGACLCMSCHRMSKGNRALLRGCGSRTFPKMESRLSLFLIADDCS